jgi:hypothetical protein
MIRRLLLQHILLLVQLRLYRKFRNHQQTGLCKRNKLGKHEHKGIMYYLIFHWFLLFHHCFALFTTQPILFTTPFSFSIAQLQLVLVLYSKSTKAVQLKSHNCPWSTMARSSAQSHQPCLPQPDSTHPYCPAKHQALHQLHVSMSQAATSDISFKLNDISYHAYISYYSDMIYMISYNLTIISYLWYSIVVESCYMLYDIIVMWCHLYDIIYMISFIW